MNSCRISRDIAPILASLRLRSGPAGQEYALASGGVGEYAPRSGDVQKNVQANDDRGFQPCREKQNPTSRLDSPESARIVKTQMMLEVVDRHVEPWS